MEIVQSLYILVKIILLITLGLFCVLIAIKVVSTLDKFEEYIKVKYETSSAICKLESRDRLQKIINRIRSENNDKLMTSDEIDEYIERMN